MTDLLNLLTNFGLPGILLAIVLYAYAKKDREKDAESKARVEDVKVLFAVIDKVTDREVALERRERDVERRERETERRELEVAKREFEPPTSRRSIR
jgi:hypothetical protein